MQNNIPEAVRLGEKMLAENGESLSAELAQAVKSYQLDHNQSYMDAMKRTGPISTSNVYKNLPKSRSGTEYGRSIVNLDDPYWRDLLDKNYRF